jgi:hypothetical protein
VRICWGRLSPHWAPALQGSSAQVVIHNGCGSDGYNTTCASALRLALPLVVY